MILSMATLAPLPPVSAVELPAQAPGTRQSWADSILPVVITLAAAALRFHSIGAKSFWLDEGFSFGIARLPWRQMLLDLWHHDFNMSLYFILLHFWLALGSSEGFIRALSALFSVGAIPVVYALGARVLGRSAGLLAAWFLAVNAFHIRYAQEARAYAMVVFFAALASWLLVKNIEEPATAHWKAYTAACVLCVYSHFYGGLLVAAHAASLAFLPRGHANWRKLVWSLAWFTGLTAPIAAFSAKTGTAQVNWLPPVTWDRLQNFGIVFAGNYGTRLMILDLAMIGLASFGAVQVWRQHGRSLETWRYGLLFSWLLAPLGIVLGASLLHPLFFPRYLSACLPALALLVAAGISTLQRAALSWAFIAAISAASLQGTIFYYEMDFDLFRANWRAASAYVFDHAQPGDSVYSYQAFDVPLEYYRRQRRPAPAWPKNLNPPSTLFDLNEEFGVIPGTILRSARPTGGRVWLLLPYVDNPAGKPDREGLAVRGWFAAGRHRAEAQRFPLIEVVLYAGGPPVAHQAENSRP
jgi:mannosyltransferase